MTRGRTEAEPGVEEWTIQPDDDVRFFDGLVVHCLSCCSLLSLQKLMSEPSQILSSRRESVAGNPTALPENEEEKPVADPRTKKKELSSRVDVVAGEIDEVKCSGVVGVLFRLREERKRFWI